MDKKQYTEVWINLYVYKNQLNISDEMRKDKTKIDEIDKITFFKFILLSNCLNKNKFEDLYNHDLLKKFIDVDYIKEQINLLESELEHIFADKEKLKDFMQEFTIWSLTNEQYYEADNFVNEVQDVFSQVLRDLPQERKYAVWNILVEKYISRKILENSLKKKLSLDIKNFKKSLKNNDK